jgi:hypothetical protein
METNWSAKKQTISCLITSLFHLVTWLTMGQWGLNWVIKYISVTQVGRIGDRQDGNGLDGQDRG